MNLLIAGIGITLCAFASGLMLYRLWRDTLSKRTSFAGVGIIVVGAFLTRFDDISILKAGSWSATLKAEATRNVADTAAFKLDAQKSAQVTEQLAVDAFIKVKELDKALVSVQAENAKLKDLSDLLFLVTRAHNDDREAYKKLIEMGADDHHPQRKLAASTAVSVMLAHSSSFYNSGFHIDWLPLIVPEKIPLFILKKEYAEIDTGMKPALLEFVAIKRTDIPLKERVTFLTEVMRTETSLRALEYAGRFFMRLTKFNAGPLETERMIDWWAKNPKLPEAE